MHVELYLKTLCQLWFEAMRATYNEVEGASLVIEGQPARKAALTQWRHKVVFAAQSNHCAKVTEIRQANV